MFSVPCWLKPKSMFNTLNLRAAAIAAVATVLLVASILIGSRNLGNFDAALIAYSESSHILNPAPDTVFIVGSPPRRRPPTFYKKIS